MRSYLALSLSLLIHSTQAYGVNYCRDLKEFNQDKFKFKDFLG
jgi:hypothetical protein